jgi:hypothetical protein
MGETPIRILYIDCDSLRPDHLGCYGYDRETSPNIDGIAADGRRLTNVYVTVGENRSLALPILTGLIGLAASGGWSAACCPNSCGGLPGTRRLTRWQVREGPVMKSLFSLRDQRNQVSVLFEHDEQ